MEAKAGQMAEERIKKEEKDEEETKQVRETKKQARIKVGEKGTLGGELILAQKA